ncbi:MAG: HPr family phosphocarrier protein, partial [Actinomyces bouchesdurhonensis]|nr:HPr family phosphocarrier protein [Actinomyces bouchesdurhonensis]
PEVVPSEEAPGAPVPLINGATEAVQASAMWAQGNAVVADPVGLHARPAAAFVRLAASFDAEITVNGADGGSVLDLMSLGVTQGDTVHIEANGADATAAVAALTDMLESANAQL